MFLDLDYDFWDLRKHFKKHLLHFELNKLGKVTSKSFSIQTALLME